MSGLLVILMVRATFVLAVASALVLAMRRSSAAARHGVWTGALGCLLSLPAAMMLLPRWEVAVLPAEPLTAVPAGTEMDAPHDAGEPSSVDPATVSAGAASVSPRRGVSMQEGLAAVWALGALYGLGRVVIGFLLVRQLVRHARPIEDAAWLRLAAEARSTLGLSSTVRLLESDRVAVPVVCGPLRPIVLIPTGSDQWPAARRRAFLLHELAHVQRRDCLVQTIASVARALYWPHPLAWWAQRRLRAEAERASDDRVVAAGMAGPAYAELLLQAARALGRAPFPVAVVAIVERSSLEDRLMALLDPTVRRGALDRPTRLAGLSVAASLIAIVAALQPVPLSTALTVIANAVPPTSAAAVAASVAAPATTARPAPTRVTAAPRPAPMVARNAPTASIVGVVVDGAGQAVASAVVEPGPAAGTRLVPEPMRTDEQGRFAIADVAAADHGLMIVAPGFITRNVRVRVEPGRITDLGRIALDGGATVSGVVTDSAGKPVSGANIAWVKGRGGLLNTRAATDGEGRFRMSGLTAGPTTFVATHPDFAPSESVQVVDGGEVRLALAAGGRIEGVVKVRRPGMSPGRVGLGGLLWSTRAPRVVGSDGTFVLDHVRAGRATVAVTVHEGAAGSRQAGNAETTVEVREGETSRVEITIDNIRVRGRVTLGEQAAVGYEVRLVGGPSASAVRTAAALVDDQGRYELVVPLSGRYQVQIRGPQALEPRPSQRTIAVPDADVFPFDITLPKPIEIDGA